MDAKVGMAKAGILARTLLDVVPLGGTVVESDDGDFFSTVTWREFEQYGSMVAQFMGATNDQTKKALGEMKQTFAAIGGGEGDSSVDRGLQNITLLQSQLKDARIDQVKPEISAKTFTNLLSSGSKDDRYNLPLFIQLVLGRDSRRFMDYFTPGTPQSPKDILDAAIQDDLKGSLDEIYEIFGRVMMANGYTKNNAQIGKAELAFAMFFGDVRLPDDQGDLEIGDGSLKVELKGHDGVIANRSSLAAVLNGEKCQSASSLPSSESLWEAIGGMDQASEIPPSKGMDAWLRSLVDRLDAAGGPDLVQRKFLLMFSALFRSYMRDNGYPMMLLLDMKSRSGSLANQRFMTNKMVQVEAHSGDPDWIADGRRVLEELTSRGVVVHCQVAHSTTEFGFKANLTKVK